MSTKDLAGETFGRLTVLSSAPSILQTNGKRCGAWNVRCECGAELVARRGALLSGNTRSCGCLQREESAARTRHGHARIGRHSPEHIAWSAMRQRCYYEKNINFKDYGGRGIIVCERWKNDFAAFLADMGSKPSRSHSLDRKDTDGNYEPSNCRWATRKEQQRNMRRNVFLTFNGETKTLSAWSESLGWKPSTIESRVKKGWSTERVLTTPLRVWPSRAAQESPPPCDSPKPTSES